MNVALGIQVWQAGRHCTGRTVVAQLLHSAALLLHSCCAVPHLPPFTAVCSHPPAAGLLHTLPQRVTAFSASPTPVPLPAAHGAVAPVAAATAAGVLDRGMGAC